MFIYPCAPTLVEHRLEQILITKQMTPYIKIFLLNIRNIKFYLYYNPTPRRTVKIREDSVKVVL